MKVFLPALLVSLLLMVHCALMPTRACAEGQDYSLNDLSLKSYMIYDINDERQVAVFNPNHKQPVASLSKLMTSILACERLRFDGRYLLTEKEQETFDVKTMRVEKMIQLALVPSNNSVCKMMARLISGNEQNFSEVMNAKALELGMTNTRFYNASGLPGGEQYSTMYDLLILSRVALTYPQIRAAVTQENVELNGKKYDGTLLKLYQRHSRLLGGKTGYTKAAGRCLVLFYSANGHNYIVITLGSEGVKEGFRDAEIILKHHGLYSGEVGAWE